MDKTKGTNAQERIKEAARQLFLKRGMAGTRMQEIADTAGINKAMLHYYFRSKEQLFGLIFTEAIEEMFPKVEKELLAERPIREKLYAFMRAYITQLRKHPYVPLFVLHEMNSGRREFMEKIQKLQAAESGRSPKQVLGILFRELKQAQRRGELPSYSIKHLWTNIIALCVFPFLARPMLQRLLQMDDRAFDAFLSERIDAASTFLEMALNNTKHK